MFWLESSFDSNPGQGELNKNKKMSSEVITCKSTSTPTLIKRTGALLETPTRLASLKTKATQSLFMPNKVINDKLRPAIISLEFGCKSR